MNFKEENSSRFYSWGTQRTVVKKVCSSSPSLFFFSRYQTSPFPPRTSVSVRRKCSPSSSWRWRRRCYHWPVDTFISVELLTGWVWYGSGRRRPLLNLFRNLSRTAQSRYLVSIYSDLMDQFEGSKITSENSCVARESSSAIILRSRLKSTGHSACTSEVRDIFFIFIFRPMYPMTDDSWCVRAFSNLDNTAIQWRRRSVILHQ